MPYKQDLVAPRTTKQQERVYLLVGSFLQSVIADMTNGLFIILRDIQASETVSKRRRGRVDVVKCCSCSTRIKHYGEGERGDERNDESATGRSAND